MPAACDVMPSVWQIFFIFLGRPAGHAHFAWAAYCIVFFCLENTSHHSDLLIAAATRRLGESAAGGKSRVGWIWNLLHRLQTGMWRVRCHFYSRDRKLHNLLSIYRYNNSHMKWIDEWINKLIHSDPIFILNRHHHSPQYITFCFYDHQGHTEYSDIMSFILFNKNIFQQRKECRRWKINLCLWMTEPGWSDMSHILVLNVATCTGSVGWGAWGWWRGDVEANTGS